MGHSEDLDSARVGKSHAHAFGLAHEPTWNRRAEWLRFPLMFGRVWPCRGSLANTNLAMPASLPLALVLLRQIRRFLVVRRATDDIRQGKAHLCRLVQLMFQPPLRPAAAEAQSDQSVTLWPSAFRPLREATLRQTKSCLPTLNIATTKAHRPPPARPMGPSWRLTAHSLYAAAQ